MYDLSEPSSRDYKITFIGHAGVGKSKLIRALESREAQFNALKNPLSGDYNLTILRNGKKAAICVWDITGDPVVITSIMPTYCRKSDIVVLCFKVGDGDSIDVMTRLYRQLMVECDVKKIVIVGTQADLYYEDSRERREALTVPFAYMNLESGTPCYLTSADTYEGVEMLLNTLWSILQEQDQIYYHTDTSISFVSLHQDGGGAVKDIKASRRGCCSIQ